MEPEEQDEPGFLRRYRVILILLVLALVGGIVFLTMGEQAAPKKKRASVSMVNIMVPPPPPTPPPTPPPQEEPPPPDAPDQPEFQEEKQPDTTAKEEPKAETPEEAAPLGSNIQGDGKDGFGLKGQGGGRIGGRGNGSGGGGTKWGRYAGQVQSRVVEALGKHRRTRSSSLIVKVRIWADATGRITRASLSGSTGDPAVDKAIETEILTGLQLEEPPPDDMPMPIVMRITAKRPN